MSKTRVFKMGHAEVFQDKPNKEAQAAIEAMERREYENCGLLVKSNLKKLAEALSDREDSELSAALKVLVREVKRLKREKEVVTQK